MTEITQAITTALGSIKSDVLTVMGATLTAGIAIFGIKFAVSQGMGFFKKVSK